MIGKMGIGKIKHDGTTGFLRITDSRIKSGDFNW